MTTRSTGWIASADHYSVPVMFNPYTGEPRDVRDVQSDPQGILIVPPGKVKMLAPTTQPASQQEAQEPFAWHVCSVNSDGSLSLEHAAAWEEAAHEHINDAITEHDIEGAGSWVVRPAYHAPQTSPAAQGDALEPVGWFDDDRVFWHEGKQPAQGSDLYTTPQPSPAAQGDALDTARLDWLLHDIGVVWSEYGAARRAIDAARAAQEGK